MDEGIAARVLVALEERVFPGCVVGVVDAGGRRVLPFGRRAGTGSPPTADDALYDCASLTKSVVTATLALQLLDEGRLSLDDALITYIPEYRAPHRDAVVIRHLLTYTLGNKLPLSRFANAAPEEIFEAVCTEDCDPPGAVFSYSNTPAFLLGIVIERVLNESLDAAAQERIFAPLGMRASTFHPHGAVPTEEGVQDIVHDEGARVFARANRAVGHAGLFSTVPDLLAFLDSLLRRSGERLTRNQLAGIGASAALGWELDQPWMGKRGSGPRFGKTGFTGCSIAIDPVRGRALAILSNRTYPHRPADAAAINRFRADLCDIVFGNE